MPQNFITLTVQFGDDLDDSSLRTIDIEVKHGTLPQEVWKKLENIICTLCADNDDIEDFTVAD